MEKKIVVGFGTKIMDKTVKMTPEFLAFANARIAAENEARAQDKKAPLPLLTKKGGQLDDLFPVLNAALTDYKGPLEIVEHEGGSVFNTFTDAKVLLGAAARNVKFIHIPTTTGIGLVFIHPESHENFKAAGKIKKDDLTLSDSDKLAVEKADIFFAPKSTCNDFFDPLMDALQLLHSKAQVFFTLHGDKPAKNIGMMTSFAHVLCGNRQESSDASYAPFLNTFRTKTKGTLQVITDGENGLEMFSGAFFRAQNTFRRHFPTAPATAADTSGAGNAAEGAILAFMISNSVKDATVQDLHDLALRANAAGGVAVTFIGTSLDPKHLPLIETRMEDIKAYVAKGALRASRKIQRAYECV